MSEHRNRKETTRVTTEATELASDETIAGVRQPPAIVFLVRTERR
jgi:hypothetical protein